MGSEGLKLRNVAIAWRSVPGIYESWTGLEVLFQGEDITNALQRPSFQVLLDTAGLIESYWRNLCKNCRSCHGVSSADVQVNYQGEYTRATKFTNSHLEAKKPQILVKCLSRRDISIEYRSLAIHLAYGWFQVSWKWCCRGPKEDCPKLLSWVPWIHYSPHDGIWANRKHSRQLQLSNLIPMPELLGKMALCQDTAKIHALSQAVSPNVCEGERTVQFQGIWGFQFSNPERHGKEPPLQHDGDILTIRGVSASFAGAYIAQAALIWPVMLSVVSNTMFTTAWLWLS